MAFLTANNAPVALSTLTLPLTGRWTMDALLSGQDQKIQAGDAVTLAYQGGITYKGYCERGGPDGSNWKALLVAGSGGLSTNIAARYYHDIPAATVVKDLLSECGEQAGEIDLPDNLPQWVRPAGPAQEALVAVLARYADRTWRFGPDGKVWVGKDGWKDWPQALPVEQDTEHAAQGRYTTTMTPKLLPGYLVTFKRGRESIPKRAVRVMHRQSFTELRTEVQFADGTDKGIDALKRLAEQAVRHVDYMAVYPCKVLKDWGDMTLDLKPNHPRLPSMTHVKLVQPIAGARVKIKVGATVLLEFQHADAARPLVTGYGMADLELLEILTGKGQYLRIDDDRGLTTDDKLYTTPHIRLQDMAGQSIELWAKKKEERIRITDKAGQIVELNAKLAAETVTVTHKTGSTLKMLTNGDVAVTPLGKLLLAGGGPPVARVGDTVQVNLTSGAGVIMTGSPKVVSG